MAFEVEYNETVATLMINTLLSENNILRSMVGSVDSSYYTALVQENAALHQQVEELLVWKEAATRFIAEMRGTLSPTPQKPEVGGHPGVSEEEYASIVGKV